jgi:hypothetical protein
MGFQLWILSLHLDVSALLTRLHQISSSKVSVMNMFLKVQFLDDCSFSSSIWIEIPRSLLINQEPVLLRNNLLFAIVAFQPQHIFQLVYFTISLSFKRFLYSKLVLIVSFFFLRGRNVHTHHDVFCSHWFKNLRLLFSWLTLLNHECSVLLSPQMLFVETIPYSLIWTNWSSHDLGRILLIHFISEITIKFSCFTCILQDNRTKVNFQVQTLPLLFVKPSVVSRFIHLTTLFRSLQSLICWSIPFASLIRFKNLCANCIWFIYLALRLYKTMFLRGRNMLLLQLFNPQFNPSSGLDH